VIENARNSSLGTTKSIHSALDQQQIVRKNNHLEPESEYDDEGTQSVWFVPESYPTKILVMPLGRHLFWFVSNYLAAYGPCGVSITYLCNFLANPRAPTGYNQTGS
jgi:hypothetical protein